MNDAESFWAAAQTGASLPSYWSHPYLDVICQSKTGGKWFLDYVKDRYFGGRPARSAVSLGCGSGEVDRIAFSKGIFDKLLGLDFSTEGLKVARAAATGLPITYVRSDFNTDAIPGADKHDLIYDYACFHHVSNLDNILASIDDHLSDDGLFVQYGYCGPARMQWSPRVIDLSNNLLQRMPMRLRQSMPELGRPTIQQFHAPGGDPSEAVRGSEVPEMTRAYFEILEEIDLGFSLSHPIFAQNASHIDTSDPSVDAIFKLVCQFEDILISEGLLPSDTKVIIARRRRV